MNGRLTRLERDVAIIKSHFVRQADLAALEARLMRAMNEQTWRLVTFVCGFGTALAAAIYFITKNSH